MEAGMEVEPPACIAEYAGLFVVGQIRVFTKYEFSVPGVTFGAEINNASRCSTTLRGPPAAEIEF